MATIKNPALGGTLISGLLVEKQDVNLSFGDKIPVLQDFDPQKAIGVAALSKTDSGITADIDLYNQADFGLFYPAIGFKVASGLWKAEGGLAIKNGVITAVGLSLTPNVDSEIKCIADQIAE